MYLRYITLLVLLWGAAGSVCADEKNGILDQKRDLQQIQQDIENSRQRLDSLEAEQRKVQKAISEHDQRISSDRKVIRRLTDELKELQQAAARADSGLAVHQELYDRTTRRYLGSMRSFYMVSQQPAKLYSDNPNEELELNRKVVYLTALAGFETANIQAASELLTRSSEELEDLSGRKKKVTGLKRSRETSYALGSSQKEREQKSLTRLRRSSLDEADRVMMLERAAEEMASIIARLEEERTAEIPPGSAPSGPSVFAGLKGQLSPPFRGKIVESFGNHTHPVTKLKSFSPGITIKGRPGSSVNIVASGTVAYAGELRGYGNFVIISHDNQYYTTYAGLSQITVSKDQYLTSRAKIGTSGQDGTIKFELRQGREPLDPVKWIQIESL
ncbi:MAG: peptidoglycan DD-metalloendopeptidase family protein [candidate division Zixibacteria bacterium]|nr:peptidoglycan DD-metalloendopeptidase family protein [candidate division Zixibacteria bacterium]